MDPVSRPPAPRPWVERWPPISYWMKVTTGVLVVLALARILLAIGNILVLLLVSLVLAIGFQPAVAWLERRGIRRGWAVAAIFLSGLVVIGAFLALVVPVIVREIRELVEQAPDYLRRAQAESGFLGELERRFELSERLRSLAGVLPGTALAIISSFTTFLFNTLTVIVLTLFFMTNLPRIRHRVAQLLTRDQRDEFEGILAESTARVGGYVVGALTVSAIAGASSFIALAIIGVPFPAALAFFTALTGLIPTIGALISMAVAATVAAFVGVPQLVATLVFYVVYQQIENYLIQPRVMRRAIDISAATVIVAVLIGGSLLGIVGALLALPLTAIVIVVVRELYLEDRIDTLEAEGLEEVHGSPS